MIINNNNNSYGTDGPFVDALPVIFTADVPGRKLLRKPGPCRAQRRSHTVENIRIFCETCIVYNHTCV